MLDREALRRLVEAHPLGATITMTMPRAWWVELLDADADATGPDYQVRDLAKLFSRSQSSVRAWCEEGRFPGAYKLRGKHWRIPRIAVTRFREAEARSRQESRALGDWRNRGKV